MQNGENPRSITKSSKFNHADLFTKPQGLPRTGHYYPKVGNGVYVQKSTRNLNIWAGERRHKQGLATPQKTFGNC
jgi:hypothetical protein